MRHKDRGNRQYKQHPLLIAEVLSPSTERVGDWLLRNFTEVDHRLSVSSLSFECRLRQIYDEVLLDPPEQQARLSINGKQRNPALRKNRDS